MAEIGKNDQELKQAGSKDRKDQPQPIPINNLAVGLTDWAIIARIIYKGPIFERKTDTNGKLEVFSIDLLDSQGTEIKMSFFRDLCLKYHATLQEGGIYKIAGGEIKKSTTVFHGSHECFIDCRSQTVIEPLPEDSKIPMLPPKLSLTRVKDVAQIDPKEKINFAGAVLGIGPIMKTSGKIQRRQIVLLDSSKEKIPLTFTGVEAESFEGKLGDIMLFRNLQISKLDQEYILNFMDWSSVFTKSFDGVPEMKELATIAQEVRDQMPNMPSKQGEEEKKIENIPEIKKESNAYELSTLRAIKSGEPGTYHARVSIQAIDQESSLFYPGCGNCLKKGTSNSWTCSCGHINKAPTYRYRVKVLLKDSSEKLEAIAFESAAMKIMLNLPANTLREWQTKKYAKILQPFFEEVLSKEYVVKISLKDKAQFVIEDALPAEK